MKSTERASFAPPSDRVVPDAHLAGALHEVSNALTVVVGWLADAQLAAEADRGGADHAGADDEARVQLRRALAVAYRHACRGYAVARRAIGAQVEDDDGTQGSLELAQDALLGAAHEAAERGVRLLLVDATSERVDSDEACRGDADGDAGIGEGGANANSVQVPARAMQILMNLLLNALAFSPPGSTVELEHRISDGYITFRVSDEGPGVPVNLRETLFVSAKSQRVGGAGIGLAHSYALAKECGGKLRLVNGTRSGACFELRLGLDEPASQVVLSGIPEAPVYRDGARARRDSSPAQAANDDRASAPPTVPSLSAPPMPSLSPPSMFPPAMRPSFAGMRILLLEDDEAVLEMVRFGLTSRGADVVASTSCEQLEALLKERFDVAVLDLSPLGDEPAATLALFQAANVPIVLISGSVAPNLGEVGLSAWVHKPFALHELYEVLSELDV